MVRPIEEKDSLQAFWKFTPNGAATARAAYSLDEILEATKNLGDSVQAIRIDHRLYRTTGFNNRNSAFVELGHWEQIHFYTTSATMRPDRIPSKLFTKPTGCDYFQGYFDIKAAFEIPKALKASKVMQGFWAKFYFYPYETGYSDSRCFVCTFRSFSHQDQKGRESYEFLKKRGYALGTRGSKIIEDPAHLRKIDAILDTNDLG